MWSNWKQVHLGSFVTAEEAALCIARSPLGQAAAVKKGVAPALHTSEEALQQARAEGQAARVAAGRAVTPPLASKEAQQQARDAIIGAVALEIIYQAAGAATAELSAEVAAEVMAGIAMGL